MTTTLKICRARGPGEGGRHNKHYVYIYIYIYIYISIPLSRMDEGEEIGAYGPDLLRERDAAGDARDDAEYAAHARHVDLCVHLIHIYI